MTWQWHNSTPNTEIVKVNEIQKIHVWWIQIQVVGRCQLIHHHFTLFTATCCILLLVYPTESNRSCRWFAMLKIVNAMDHSQRAARAWVDVRLEKGKSNEIGWNSKTIAQNWKLPCCIVDNDVWLGTKDKFQRPALSRKKLTSFLHESTYLDRNFIATLVFAQ